MQHDGGITQAFRRIVGSFVSRRRKYRTTTNQVSYPVRPGPKRAQHDKPENHCKQAIVCLNAYRFFDAMHTLALVIGHVTLNNRLGLFSNAFLIAVFDGFAILINVFTNVLRTQ